MCGEDNYQRLNIPYICPVWIQIQDGWLSRHIKHIQIKTQGMVKSQATEPKDEGTIWERAGNNIQRYRKGSGITGWYRTGAICQSAPDVDWYNLIFFIHNE